MKFKFILIISIIISPISYSHPSKIHTQNGIIEIDVLVNDSIKARFGVDTGTDRLYITKTFAEKNEIKISRAPGQRPVQTAFGVFNPSQSILNRIKLTNDILLEDIETPVLDLPQITSDTLNPLAGLIGNNILKDYIITLNYQEGWIDFSNQFPDYVNYSDYIEVPFTLQQNQIIVSATIDAQYVFPMLVDFCATSTYLTNETDLFQESMDYSKHIRLVGEIENPKVPVKYIDLEPIERRLPKSGIKGILGMSFLKDYTITIDYKSQIIYFQR